MSSIPSRELDEAFVEDFYIGPLTEQEIQTVLAAWEPHRSRIENILEDYDSETQSWRDYRNVAFAWLCDLCPLSQG